MSEAKVVEAKTQKSLHDFDPQKKPKRNKYAFACAMLASMTSILLGYGNYYTTPSHLYNCFLVYIIFLLLLYTLSAKYKRKIIFYIHKNLLYLVNIIWIRYISFSINLKSNFCLILWIRCNIHIHFLQKKERQMLIFDMSSCYRYWSYEWSSNLHKKRS
jgi:hypothetical protein